jgi:hypothetical protein
VSKGVSVYVCGASMGGTMRLARCASGSTFEKSSFEKSADNNNNIRSLDLLVLLI